MNEVKKIYYITPVILALIIFFSNFLGADLISGEIYKFTVWFVLSLFAFACGWIINLTLGWEYGGKITFAVIVAATLLSLVLILAFVGYFEQSEEKAVLPMDTLVLYSLRNIFLGLMGVFGMAVSNVFQLQRKVEKMSAGWQGSEKIIQNAEKESEIIVKEAKLNADKIITDAKKQANQIIEVRNKIERQIKEFIQIEKDLIKKYEENE